MITKRGFTLVEIMIVVIIIGIVGIAAIPSLIRTKLIANESTVQSDIRAVASALEIYRSNQVVPAYPALLTELAQDENPILDPAVAAGRQHGFIFTYKADDSLNSYTIVASPIQAGITGNRLFCADTSGVLKEYTGGSVMSNGDTCPNSSLLITAEVIDE